MGVSPATFNSAGKSSQHYIPGVYSRSNSVGGNTGVSTGNLCIIGSSMGGKPLSLLNFSDKADAVNTLLSGDLLNGVLHAMFGSNQYHPQSVYAIRVNNGLQSTRTLKSGENTVLTVKSADYGIHTNQLKMWYSEGTTTGSRIEVSYKGSTVTVDNIEKKTLAINYIGSGESAKCTINGSGLSLSATDTEGETIDTETIDFENYSTVDALVSRINDTEAYYATQLDNTSGVKSSELDHVTNVNIDTSNETVFKSNLQALIDELKKVQYIGEVSLASEANRTLPDEDSSYVYFTGGTAGTSTISDYSAAIEVLSKEDIQIIATPETSTDVLNLIASHCAEMSSIDNKKERTMWCGMQNGTTVANGIAYANSLNSELVSVVIDSANAANPNTGALEEISPALLACKCAGIESAIGLSMPLTNKSIKVSSFGKKRSRNELETMIKGGLVTFGENDSGELVCIRALTTYQGDNLVMNERSMQRSVMYMDRDLRKAYSARIGTNKAPSEAEIIQILLNKAKQWDTDDLIVKDESGNLVFDAKVRFDGDKAYLTYSRYVRSPNNFVFITSTNEVYSSEV